MRAVKGYTKEDYLKNAKKSKTREFANMEEAVKYVSRVFKMDKQTAQKSIENDTNCDMIYFEDGSVIVIREYKKRLKDD